MFQIDHNYQNRDYRNLRIFPTAPNFHIIQNIIKIIMLFKKPSMININPTLKTEKVQQTEEKNKFRQVRPSQFLNILDVLPALKEKITQQQKEIIDKRRSVLKEKQNFFLPQIASPQPEPYFPKKSVAVSLQLMPKISISIEQEKQKIKRHVGFKNSIRIIDYTNDIISRDYIDGEQKPLQRVRHRKTKTEADY
ncbi:hypothetical protein pb186bvf_005152 [Paramecium bursaria]